MYILTYIFKFIFLLKKKKEKLFSSTFTNHGTSARKCNLSRQNFPAQPTDYWPRNVTIRKSNFPVATLSPFLLPPPGIAATSGESGVKVL